VHKIFKLKQNAFTDIHIPTETEGIKLKAYVYM